MTGEPGDRRQQMQKKGGQIAHRTMLRRSRHGRECSGLLEFGMHKPVLVAQIEFLEWTGENYLRHTKFVALRDDKPARDVRREYSQPNCPLASGCQPGKTQP